MTTPPTTATAARVPANPVDTRSLQHNIQALTTARSFMAMVFGAAAGVLGLTNFHGLLFYALTSIFMSLALHLFVVRGNPTKYLTEKNPTVTLWTEGVVGGGFSYLLFWTLAYGMVHVYD